MLYRLRGAGWEQIAAAAPVAPANTTSMMLQYGAIGAIATVALFAVRILFNRLVAINERETARADRLEEELRKLNETVRTDYVSTIANASHAISEANRAITDALAAVRRS